MTEKLTIELWKRVSRVLDELLELEPECRQDSLERMCADDPDLLGWTRTFLQAADEADDFLERIPFAEARQRLFRILASAGPGSAGSTCLQREGHLGPDEFGSDELNAPGRNEK